MWTSDHRWRSTPWHGAGLIVSLLVLLASDVAAGKKVWSISPARGFVDDAMAFDGRRKLAYIHTDAAQFLELILVDLSTLKPGTTIKIDQPRRVPRQLFFTPDGSRLLLVWIDGHSGKHGATLFDAASGKQLGEIKAGADFAAVVDHEGTPCLTLGQTRSDKSGAQRLSLVVHRVQDLRRVKTARLTVAADRTLRRPPLRLLYFEPGHLSLVGMKRGDYDRKRDIRLPDQAVRYDLLRSKIVWSEEPQDIVKWTLATNMRPNHPGQLRFLQVSDDLRTLYSVDRDNRLAEVTTPVAWKLYEPRSLKQAETWDGKALYFSMTVDPVNPDAVARKKADQERCDLYRLDPGPKARPLGSVLTGERRFHWLVGAAHFAYLHKLKGFGRGGKTLELYTVD